ncbi:hypothetical protein Tco_1233551, partial [Tanacetum coccineum]
METTSKPTTTKIPPILDTPLEATTTTTKTPPFIVFEATLSVTQPSPTTTQSSTELVVGPPLSGRPKRN